MWQKKATQPEGENVDDDGEHRPHQHHHPNHSHPHPHHPHHRALRQIDTLLYMFEHLSLRDCFSCRAVCRRWSAAVDVHFRRIATLRIEYREREQVGEYDRQQSEEEYMIFPEVSTTAAAANSTTTTQSRTQCTTTTTTTATMTTTMLRFDTLGVYEILNYDRFAQTLALFPSVRHFELARLPMNDIFLALIVIFLPRLTQLQLRSCFVQPSASSSSWLALQPRTDRNRAQSDENGSAELSPILKSIWNALNRIYYYGGKSTIESAQTSAQTSAINDDDDDVGHIREIVKQFIAATQSDNKRNRELDHRLLIEANRSNVAACCDHAKDCIHMPRWWRVLALIRQESEVQVEVEVEEGEVPNLNANSTEQLTRLSAWGYRVLVNNYRGLTILSLTDCGLTEAMCEILLRELPQIKTLDIANNEEIDGPCLRQLPASCESLVVGSFNPQVSIHRLLDGIVRSSAAEKRTLIALELIGAIVSDLRQFEQLTHLRTLTLRFYCDYMAIQQMQQQRQQRQQQPQPFAPFHSIGVLRELRHLSLHQEYCYEEQSAIDHGSLVEIVRQCEWLRRLEILGEYEWKLRIDDDTLNAVAIYGKNLRHLAITGNSITITENGFVSLTKMVSLETLNLISFNDITDRVIKRIISELPRLSNLCLRDNRKLTVSTIDACIVAAKADPDRTITLRIDEKQMSASRLLMDSANAFMRDKWQSCIFRIGTYYRSEELESTTEQSKSKSDSTLDHNEAAHNYQRKKNKQRWPPNLNVVIEENLRSYKYDVNELTLMKLIAIFCSSIMIIAMMIATLLVVIVLPFSMVAYLVYEKVIANFIIWQQQIGVEKS